MRKIYYFGHITGSVNEGGMARNYAFKTYFEEQNANVYNLYNKNLAVRFLKLIFCVFKLFTLKKKVVFIHQGTLLLMFPIFLHRYSVSRKFLVYLLEYVSARNKLFVEVNDLPFEQSIDLGLNVNDLYIEFQKNLYSLKGIFYVFASHEMQRYVKETYNLEFVQCQTILNGGSKLISKSAKFNHFQWIQSDKTKYVYAGSLNKGRQIEELLNLFNRRSEYLILIGQGGEWLDDILLSNNILYLGSFSEADAQGLVSQCDIGIIPYDDSKFYYNLCYPTKASFYVTAGIPFLSTHLTELEKNFRPFNMAIFSSFRNWDNILNSTNLATINLMKSDVELNSKYFTWDTLLSKLKL